MTDLAQLTRVKGMRRFLERPPADAVCVQLIARSDPPMVLQTAPVATVKDEPGEVWEDFVTAMDAHLLACGVAVYLLAWVDANGNASTSKMHTHESAHAALMTTRGDPQSIAARMDGSDASRLAQGQQHVFDMVKLCMQTQTAQMAQAIMLLDKFSEKALVAMQGENTARAELVRLQEENAQLVAQLENMPDPDEATPNEGTQNAIASLVDAAKPYLPMVMARLAGVGTPTNGIAKVEP